MVPRPFRTSMQPSVTSRTVTLAMLVASVGACTPSDKNIQARFDRTGMLQQLVYDSNGNGKPDTWSYMEGARVLRIEIDQDEDGAVDRREYYDANRALEKVGTSRAGIGKADTWSFPAADGTVARVETSARPDGKITRTEFYERGVLARAEEDGDSDGGVDRWETYTNGRLQSIAFDTRSSGRPTRRLVYGPDGQVVQTELGDDVTRRATKP